MVEFVNGAEILIAGFVRASGRYGWVFCFSGKGDFCESVPCVRIWFGGTRMIFRIHIMIIS